MADETKRRGRYGGWAMSLLLVLCLLASSACGGDDSSELLSLEAPRPTAYDELSIVEAESLLEDHRVERAHQLYREELEKGDGRTRGLAAAGKGLTGLMLIAGSDPVRSFGIAQLGVTRPRYDIERILWGRDGALYWFSQGVRWENDGEYEGVRSILADHLPWSLERLESYETFAQGLDQSGDIILDGLMEIALELSTIEDDLEVAIEDRNFEYIYLPGATFHSSMLSMTLGKSEISLIHAATSAVRSAIFFAASYQNRWTLEELFVVQEGLDPETSFYTALDPLFFRQLEMQTSERLLKESKTACADALYYLDRALSFAESEPVTELSPLRWDRVELDTISTYRDLIRGVSASLDEETTLEEFEPDVRLDLSPIFEGRVLSEEIEWFAPGSNPETVQEGIDLFEPSMWSVRQEARISFLYEEVVTPAVSSDGTWPVQFVYSEDEVENFIRRVTQIFSDRLEGAYEGSGLFDR